VKKNATTAKASRIVLVITCLVAIDLGDIQAFFICYRNDAIERERGRGGEGERERGREGERERGRVGDAG
jgi:hypothetical protein